VNEEAELLYQRARTLEPGERAALVEEVCRGDPRLRDELLSLLLEADAAETFFRLFGDAVSSNRFFPIHEVGAGPHGEEIGDGPPPLRPELRAGARIGRYQILSVIGRGGMGTVYRAEDTVLERQVALKFLPPLSTRLDDEERLLKEARSAAALEHPNVCTIHEIGQTDDGRPFITMALYEGETLKERLERGPLSSEETVSIGVQIARGLGAAHARGILHRDVKPGNVILGSDGTARVVDFGLATMFDATRGRTSPIAGTAAYMSPEQIRGEPLDARSDLWSLGVVLYEMVAGRRPFTGENGQMLRQSILVEDPEPLTQLTGVPRPLARIVERLLAKEPGLRYGSIAEVVADLADTVPSGTAPGLPRQSRRRAVLLAASAALLVALVGMWIWLPQRANGPALAVTNALAKPSIAVLPLANLSADPRDEALVNGITEDLIALLGGNEGLRVIASSSVFALREPRGDVRAIADSLGVSHILEGGLQKNGSRLRVHIRLVDARNGSTRWSQTYDRDFEEVYSVQDEITRAVAGALNLPPTVSTNTQALRLQRGSLAAYEFYLRGRDRTLTRSDSGVREAIGYFQQAIAADSTYAPGHAGLAWMYVRMAANKDPGQPLPELLAIAEQAARKAIALDDSLAMAHVALARVRLAEFDFSSAEIEARRAKTLDPMEPRVSGLLVDLYLWTGRSASALAEARRSLDVDPLNPSAHRRMADVLFANRRYDDALKALDRLADIRPPLLAVAVVTGQCYAKKGMLSDAIAALRPQAEAGEPMTLALLGHTLARAGQREEANRILRDLLTRQQRIGVGAFEVAMVHAGLGDLDQAFAWLDRSIDDRSLGHTIMGPTFDDLHEDPRFEDLRARLGLQKL
jgi:serine/threonine-protein kinase